MLPGAKVGTDFPVQLLIISEPDGERRLRVRLGAERPGERCVIPGVEQFPATAPGNRDESISGGVEPQCMVCMVMDLVASEQCDGRQRADLASLPMTG
jgi:hypothetical protein